MGTLRSRNDSPPPQRSRVEGRPEAAPLGRRPASPIGRPARPPPLAASAGPSAAGAGTAPQRAASAAASSRTEGGASLRYREVGSDGGARLEGNAAYLAEQNHQLRLIVHPLLARLQLPAVSPLRLLSFDAVLLSPFGGGGAAVAAAELGREVAKRVGDRLRGSQVELRIHACTGATPELIMAGISIGLFLAAAEAPVDFRLQVGGLEARAVEGAWQDWARRAGRPGPMRDLLAPLPARQPLREALPSSLCGREWISEDNLPGSRLSRLAAAVCTLRFGLSLHARPVHHFVRGGGAAATAAAAGPAVEIEMANDARGALDAAVAETRAGRKVAVVGAASAWHPGGAFLTGGRHALEEAMCMQSTLFLSLAEARREAETSAAAGSIHGRLAWSGRKAYIPDDSAVLSLGVKVFREGTSKGYAPLDEIVEIAGVVSIAMPNRNPLVSDSPVDYRSGPEYERVVAAKFDAVLQGAREAGAEVLVIPAVGCGVFRNDPRQLGRLLGRALRGARLRQGGCLRKVLFAGDCSEFERAARAEAVAGHSFETSAYVRTWPSSFYPSAAHSYFSGPQGADVRAAGLPSDHRPLTAPIITADPRQKNGV